MGSNRKHSRPSSDSTTESSKRPRTSDSSKQSYTQGRVDPTFGQRSALPGLDSAGEEEDIEYTDMDALAYLRSVRQEATRIPTVLYAPTPCSREIYDDGTGDARGWYGDGAYTAAPSTPSSTSAEGQDAQSAYFDSIVVRLRALRARLAALEGGRAQVTGTAASYASWRWKVRNSDPLMGEVAGMEKESVLRLLKMVSTGSSWMGRGRQVDARTSAWVWSLLGRLPDVGELGSEEVGVVRELGKRAVWVGIGFKEAGRWDGDEVEREVWGEGEGEGEGDLEGEVRVEVHDEAVADLQTAETEPEEDIEKIRARLLSRLDSRGDDAGDKMETAPAPTEAIPAQIETTRPANHIAKDTEQDPSQPTKNTRATLDMIITIAGEVYGQRDLLEFREVWE